MQLSSKVPESLRVRWDPSFNFGHIIIVLTLLAAVFGAYSDVQRTGDNHELRITRVEDELRRSASESAVFRAEIRTTLQKILNDLAVLKYDEERRRERDRSDAPQSIPLDPREPWSG